MATCVYIQRITDGKGREGTKGTYLPFKDSQTFF